LNPGNQCGARLTIEHNGSDAATDVTTGAGVEHDETAYDPGPPLTLTVAEEFVRELLMLFVQSGRQFLVSVPKDAKLDSTFPADCTTRNDVEAILAVLGERVLTTNPHSIYPIHAWGLRANNAREDFWLLTEFSRDSDDESLWVTLLEKGVLQLTIAESTCDLFSNCDDLDDTLAVLTRALRLLPYPCRWTQA
jgi:hypothetical protein